MHRSRSLLLTAGKAAKGAAAVAAGSAPAPTAYPYKLLHHHKQPTLMPPSRQPGTLSYALYNASSAVSAAFSLCTSQESRDRFMALTGSNDWSTSNDGEEGNEDDESGRIIKTKILGQSDVGFLKVLTLFQELNNPLYRQYPKFDVHEFVDGCGWALEQFHRTKDDLFPKLMDAVTEGGSGEANEVEAQGGRSEGAQHGMSLNCSYDFADEAMKDADSQEFILVSMTTPEALDIIKMQAVVKLLVGGFVGREDMASHPLLRGGNANDLRESYVQNAKPVEEDAKVSNVALLSARVEELYPAIMSFEDFRKDREQKRQAQRGDDDPDAPLEDDSFINPDDTWKDVESKKQVVTQLEVLYELQQSYIDADGKTDTQASVMVAKFEACLGGDPNGDDSLQWRIASYRPAVEFGYYNAW